jgi:6-phosphogluconolactonase
MVNPTHRQILRNRLVLQAVFTMNLIFASQMGAALMAGDFDVWIGTGGRPSQGIYHCMLDDNGGLSQSKLVAEINSPGFLALHPSLPRLYAVGGLDGKQVVAAYEVTSTGPDAGLQLVNSLEIGDGGATHLALSRDGLMLLTAQYGGGSVAAFQLDARGNLQRRTELIEHSGGSGAVADRQKSPHPHWTGFSPDQRFALVPDLGLDQVVIYRADTASAKLQSHGVGQLPDGAGPRHLKFHPNGKWIYVVNELDLTVSFFDWNATDGAMTIRQTLPSVAADQLGRLKQKSCSEIRIHPSGRFVYSANRGHDSITAFAIADDGTLKEIQNESVRGATPRNFNIDPAGRYLLAAGQDSHTLASFLVDPASGLLSYNHSVISTPSPICVLFQPE